MDNEYVDGLRQYDSRARSPVVVPHNISALRKKILFENNLLEERALHEFSASKGDGAGVDTGSAPLKPLTSLTPTPTRTPTPTPTPAPAGIPVASASVITIAGLTLSYGNTLYRKNSTNVPNGSIVVVYHYGCRVDVSGEGYKVIYSSVLNPLASEASDATILVGPGAYVYNYYTENMILEDNPNWQIFDLIRDSESCDYYLSTVIATNASTDPATIPTTGWSPGITIAAA
jgi:hypothetical protein